MRIDQPADNLFSLYPPETVPDGIPDDGESKRERFIRIAERRTQVVLDRIRILANCSNRGAYEYTPADVEKIFSTIAREIDEARRKFDRTKGPREFKL